WHRTGTTSLHVALQQLGYRVHGFDRALVDDQMVGRYTRIWAAARRSNGFRDFPWTLMYRELDMRYPNARFILTERDPDSWIESYKRHDEAHRGAEHHVWLYGLRGPEQNEAAFIRTFVNHNAAVKQHFAERPDRLRVVNVLQG